MKKIIVIPFNIPWEWSTDYTNQTAFVLGHTNIVVCYMWTDCLSIKEYLAKRKFPILIKRYSKNIYQFYPIMIIPFRRFVRITKINEYLNILLLKFFTNILSITHNTKQKILWIFDPKTEPLTKYFKRPWKSIYDCVDYFIGTGINSSEKKMIERSETKLTHEVDLVVANSHVLKKHLETIRKDVYLVPQGFRIDTFKDFKKNKEIPTIKNDKRPLIGFVGAVNYRIDYKLIYEVARKNKNWDFVLWGPELQIAQFSKEQKKYINHLKTLPNLIFGKSEKSEIPGIVSQFDIGMIPYIPDDDFNKYCYPMKLFEYFYLGKPIISTPIEELERFPKLVKIGTNYKMWENIIRSFLAKPWPDKNKKIEMRLAIENSWENKVNTILTYITKSS